MLSFCLWCHNLHVWWSFACAALDFKLSSDINETDIWWRATLTCSGPRSVCIGRSECTTLTFTSELGCNQHRKALRLQSAEEMICKQDFSCSHSLQRFLVVAAIATTATSSRTNNLSSNYRTATSRDIDMFANSWTNAIDVSVKNN